MYLGAARGGGIGLCKFPPTDSSEQLPSMVSTPTDGSPIDKQPVPSICVNPFAP